MTITGYINYDPPVFMKLTNLCGGNCKALNVCMSFILQFFATNLKIAILKGTQTFKGFEGLHLFLTIEDIYIINTLVAISSDFKIVDLEKKQIR